MENDFRPNWLAIVAILVGLITVGFLLGKIAGMPDGQTLQCPEEDWVQIVGTGQGDVEGVNHVLVYCEPPAFN